MRRMRPFPLIALALLGVPMLANAQVKLAGVELPLIGNAESGRDENEFQEWVASQPDFLSLPLLPDRRYMPSAVVCKAVNEALSLSDALSEFSIQPLPKPAWRPSKPFFRFQQQAVIAVRLVDDDRPLMRVPDEPEALGIDCCLRALLGPQEHLRLQSVRTLARQDTRRVSDPLAALVTDDPSPLVRSAAAQALALLGARGLVPGKTALDALKRAAQHDYDPQVRHAAQFAAEIVEASRAEEP